MTAQKDRPHTAPSPRRTRWLGVGVLAILLSGCAGQLPPLPPPAPGPYRLGAGDQLRVLTYNDLQLSNSFTVGDNGQIAFPLIGSLQASGLTTHELQALIVDQLTSKGILNRPSVSVEVTQYRPIFVLGEVAHPGQYPYMPGMTMLSAVALAGGYTYRAVTDHAGDVRSDAGGSGRTIEGRVRRDSLLQPGDVITVYERYF
ncbi:polysaccharide export protein [Gluconacetobacter azotocaptans]|uniref:Polysaccharide export protein n=1 Tax=Gluconacetobacter azotocaptans TaxID=142834 RepID=A0A7W4JPR1_9PROT|nr:polysaccharide biosynthesis/export family protein [Gluconacetobacter azotocaptans]MBB2188527.1 polysaccharide export protein [Gluconacetobacter azotocaptans]MBM9400233.1 polysaccharide export protein [Gluconacetobacter azotocaptans]GBQ28071.1 polysaccharide export protein AceH [Gluconacetobacter azotocaptans DSM 13594]